MLGLADIYIFEEAFRRLKRACGVVSLQPGERPRIPPHLAPLCEELVGKAALQAAALRENAGLLRSMQPDLKDILAEYEEEWRTAVELAAKLNVALGTPPAGAGDPHGTWFDLPSPASAFLSAEALGEPRPGTTSDADEGSDLSDVLVTRLDAALQSADVGVWEIDLANRRAWVSDSLLAIQGYRRDEALRHPDWPGHFMPIMTRQHVHPDDWGSLEALVNEFVIGNTNICEPEFRVRHKQGHWVWVTNLARICERDATGRAIRFHGARLEITRQRETESRLRSVISELHQTKRKLDMAIEGGNLGIWSWDQASRRGVFSPVAAAMLGTGRSITFGSLFRMIDREDWQKVRGFFRTIAQGRRSEVEFRVARRGELRWLHCVGRQTIDTDGMATTDGIMFDITEARTAELRIQKNREELDDARIRALRYQVNPHFLFNTLSAISTLILDNEASRADDMIMKLAAFYRESLKHDPLKLVTLGEEVRMQEAYLAIEQIRFPELRADFQIPDSLTDMLLPSLVLQPLVENSIKYAPGRPGKDFFLAVKAREEGGRALITIVDNGPGKAKKGGTGWGLQLTRSRLQIAFPDQTEFSAGPLPECGFAVSFSVPIVRKDTQAEMTVN